VSLPFEGQNLAYGKNFAVTFEDDVKNGISESVSKNTNATSQVWNNANPINESLENKNTNPKDDFKKVSSSDKKKLTKIEKTKESVFPLSPKEARIIREMSESYKKVVEEDPAKKGKTREIFYDKSQIQKLYLSVNYATTICFWNKIDENGYVVGSQTFKVTITPNKKCLVVFPQNEFKESNLIAFVNGEPLHFLVREVYDGSQVDLNVFVKKKPDVSPLDFVRMLVAGEIPDDWMSLTERVTLTDEERKKGFIKKYFFNGQQKFFVVLVLKDHMPLEFLGSARMCLEEVCYVIVKKDR
jgi:hypothetical protein